MILFAPEPSSSGHGISSRNILASLPAEWPQELVEGPVPLKQGEAVSGDGNTYGLATELGAEEV